MKERYTIQVVAQHTGLSQHVIRAWERRYHAVRPERSPTNRRIYTLGDIERLVLLRRVTMAGHNIGRVAGLPNAELASLLGASSLPERRLTGNGVAQSLEAAVEAVEQLDAERLDGILHQTTRRWSRSTVIEQLVLPLMDRLGEGWREGSSRVAHEHLATATIRSFLGSIERSYPAPTAAPGLVVATPSGQMHELGALAVAAVAGAEGFRVTYLGASLPAEEIVATATLRRASAVAVSITYPEDDAVLPGELERTAKGVPPGTSLLVGGRSARAYRRTLEAIDAIWVEDLRTLRLVLAGIRRARGGAPR